MGGGGTSKVGTYACHFGSAGSAGVVCLSWYGACDIPSPSRLLYTTVGRFVFLGKVG